MKPAAYTSGGTPPFVMNDIIMDELARRIAAYLRPDANWDFADIALHCKRSESYVATHLSKLPGFPPAIRLPSRADKPGHPIYEAAEIKAFVRKYKDSVGCGRPRKRHRGQDDRP